MAKPIKQYDSVPGAKLMLALALHRKSRVLNATQTQKLLYIAFGYFLANEDFELFTEDPKAWPYGPVFPRVTKKVDFSGVVPMNDPSIAEISGDPAVVEIFSKIVDGYSTLSASKLSEWSHQPGGPWDLAMKNGNGSWNTPIPHELIKEYFSKFTL